MTEFTPELKAELETLFLNEVQSNPKKYKNHIIHVDTLCDLVGQAGFDMDDDEDFFDIEGELEIIANDHGFRIDSGCSDGGVHEYR